MEATEEELVTLKQFREMIPELLPLMTSYQGHNISLLRFLRARDLDLEKATTMIKKQWEWREKNHIDNLLKMELPEDLATNFPVKVCGFSKDGYPVVLCHCGVWDFKQYIVEEGKKDQFVLYIQQFFEQATKFCEHFTTSNKFISQAYIVIDAEGFSPRQLTSQEVFLAVLKLIRIFEGNYPEMLRVGFVINVPTIFLVSWNIIKNFLAQRTASKIRLLGGKNAWQQELFKIIDPENWPSDYGGAITTCIDYKLSYGFDVFPIYENFSEKEFTNVTIAAGCKHTIDVSVEGGWKLSYNFKSDQYDIGFCVHFEDDQQLVKYCRVNSHIYTQKGIIQARKTGQYTLTFDNSYSSFKSKHVSYAIRTTLSK